jgi:hypothetical protein
MVAISLSPATVGSRSTRVDFFPKLQPGEILSYEITYHADKQTKTKGSISLAQSPGDAVADVRALLQIEILDVSPQGSRAVIHARAKFLPADVDATPAGRTQSPPSSSTEPQGSQQTKKPVVEFTIQPDGLAKITGFDALTLDQQQAWQQWAARFAAFAIFPLDGVKPAQKWQSEEPEKSLSPIAGLTWVRDSTYVRNAPCRPLRLTQQGDPVESDKPADTCAVILTTATLKQQSPAKDTTPEDFRLRQLRTSGTAHGNNKTILYISLRDAVIVRATDEADQAMSVTVSKADASNQVHYDIQAKSAAEIVLVTGALPQKP